ncbi:MAG: oligosaccharide flippase family protein [Saprospiraceae bacterium]|nr:oligosaccharide flippase family protein [Saprospiraceae bacterium]
MAFFNHAFRNLLAKIATAGIAFCATLMLPSMVGIEHFGIYAYIVVCIGFIIPITSFGFGAGTIYLLSSKRYHIHNTLITQLVLACFFGLLNVLFLLLLNAVGWLGSSFDEISQIEWLFFLTACWMQTLNFFMGRSLFGVSAFGSLNILDLTSSALHPILLLGSLCFFGGEQLYYIFFAQWLFALILFLMHVSILFRFSFQYSFDKLFVKDSLSYGLKSWLGDMALRANLRLDQMILGAISTATNIGVYNIAVKLTELIWYFPDALGPVLFNRLAETDSEVVRIGLLARIHRVVLCLCAMLSFIWILVVYFMVIPCFFKDSSQELNFAFFYPYAGLVNFGFFKIAYKIIFLLRQSNMDELCKFGRKCTCIRTLFFTHS